MPIVFCFVRTFCCVVAATVKSPNFRTDSACIAALAKRVDDEIDNDDVVRCSRARKR